MMCVDALKYDILSRNIELSGKITKHTYLNGVVFHVTTNNH